MKVAINRNAKNQSNINNQNKRNYDEREEIIA